MEKEYGRHQVQAGLQPFRTQETPRLYAEDVVLATLSEEAARLGGSPLLQRIIAPMLKQHHQETAKDREKIEDQQNGEPPAKWQKQETGQSKDERHSQVGGLPELRERKESVPRSMSDGARLDECVHHGLVMLEKELEKEVGDEEAQHD